jgi:hypothetical protein
LERGGQHSVQNCARDSHLPSCSCPWIHERISAMSFWTARGHVPPRRKRPQPAGPITLVAK